MKTRASLVAVVMILAASCVPACGSSDTNPDELSGGSGGIAKDGGGSGGDSSVGGTGGVAGSGASGKAGDSGVAGSGASAGTAGAAGAGPCGGAGQLCCATSNACESGLLCTASGSCQSNGGANVYVLPALTDSWILPSTTISSAYSRNRIALSGCAGEYKPAKFAISTTTDITGLAISAGDLTSSAGSIPAANIDIKVVKCWYQSESSPPGDYWVSDLRAPSANMLVPELLLHDDTLVNVDGGEDYVKLIDGSYAWVSQKVAATTDNAVKVADFPVAGDAATLQPVDIPAGTNKQFWVTVHVPDNAAAGDYAGHISLGNIGAMNIDLTVLPFALEPSPMIHSLYYMSILDPGYPDGTVGGYGGTLGWGAPRSEAQVSAEMKDQFEHGMTHLIAYQDWYDTSSLTVYVQRMQLTGFNRSEFFFLSDGLASAVNGNEVSPMIDWLAPYGITSLYLYGIDEADDAHGTLQPQRADWVSARAAGAKVFASGGPDNVIDMVDIQDLMVRSDAPSASEAATWHSHGHKICSYANPQTGAESPEIYRRNFGLLLWQKDFDGAMDFAYNWSEGNQIWNDFSAPGNHYKSHAFTYPTSSGIVDTIEWEGYREAVTDIRYLYTLFRAVTTAKGAGKDTSAIDSWIANLKSSNLANENLDDIRASIISYILTLST